MASLQRLVMNQKLRTLLLLVTCFFLFTAASHSFKTEQQKYPRVKTAYTEKEALITRQLASKGIHIKEPVQLYLRAFKEEAIIELWAKNSTAKTFQLVDTFEICSMSGTIGPKRKQGDRQVPEGFYHIDRFNPASSFYLSLGINYPNTSDKIIGGNNNPGGDIFIHGACVSIGCMALTDEPIKALYIYCVEAYNGGQAKIPVTIFPARLTSANFNRLIKQVPAQTELWTEMKSAYTFFNANKKLPGISFLENGRHKVSEQK